MIQLRDNPNHEHVGGTRNTDKAQHTLTKMLAWRAEMGVDGIKSAPENAARELKVLKYMTYYTGLTDRNQQPVCAMTCFVGGAIWMTRKCRWRSGELAGLDRGNSCR
jgi:hypothetical protein